MNFFRFALKRHRNIHEKYGRTKPNPPPQTADETPQDSNTSNQESADQIELTETKYEDTKYEDTKYEDPDPTAEITEEMAEISELQVQLS